jgi:cytochrome c oxidase subunit 2
MNIPGNIITLIAGILLTLISLWYGQNHGLLPTAASQGAEDIDGLFNFMMTIATGLFLIVEGVLVYCLFKFRRKKGDQTDGPPMEGNVPLEIVWTAIPTVIVFVLALYSFEVYNNIGGLDPAVSRDLAAEEIAMLEQTSSEMIALNPDQQNIALGIGTSAKQEAQTPLVVDVNAIQYAWIFTYPETGTVSGELHVPINKPVQLNLNAGDVIHAFWVPQLRLKQDVIPGRDSEVIFTANKIGDYPLICAELCGPYHGGMKSILHVEAEEDYQKWLQDNTFASIEDLEKSVAFNTENLSDGEFLSLYTEDTEINQDTLAQLHQIHHQHLATSVK